MSCEKKDKKESPDFSKGRIELPKELLEEEGIAEVIRKMNMANENKEIRAMLEAREKFLKSQEADTINPEDSI